MPEIMRTHFTWSAFPGSPGHTSLYFAGGSPAQTVATVAAAFMFDATFLSNNGGALPNGVRITQDPFVDTIEDTNGDQTGRLSVAPGTVITGSGALNWAGPAGSAVTWSTNNFIKGRRLRGRTYFVPLDGTAFQTDGTLGATYLTAIQTAIGNLIAATPMFVIWHRPTTPGGVDGQSSEVIAGQVADKVAVLTSRRD